MPNKFIDMMTGGEHSKRIAAGLCTICRNPIGKFKDELSETEYKISGMCQKCQDSVFDIGEEDEY